VKGTKIVVQKRVGENGQLFGSVTTNEIADALHAKGLEVDKRRIELTHAIKSLGTHDVEVRLHRDVLAQIQVEVVPLGVEKLEEAPQQQ
jgi:large subunit ribosomal protein L9